MILERKINISIRSQQTILIIQEHMRTITMLGQMRRRSKRNIRMDSSRRINILSVQIKEAEENLLQMMTMKMTMMDRKIT
jgi:hypothetical protein